MFVLFPVLGHPHTFFCRLELGSDWEVPNKFQDVLEVEFDMPAASASKTSVRSLSVRDRAELKKWITYKAHYSYQVLCMCGRLKTKHGSMICAHKCLHEHPQRENFTSETFPFTTVYL